MLSNGCKTLSSFCKTLSNDCKTLISSRKIVSKRCKLLNNDFTQPRWDYKTNAWNHEGTTTCNLSTSNYLLLIGEWSVIASDAGVRQSLRASLPKSFFFGKIRKGFSRLLHFVRNDESMITRTNERMQLAASSQKPATFFKNNYNNDNPYTQPFTKWLYNPKYWWPEAPDSSAPTFVKS